MSNNTSPLGSLPCPTPSWPSTAACSGRGQCDQGICICQEGWTGKHDFLDTFNTDCATDKNARTILFSIAYAVAALLIISSCYMMIKQRPLVLFNSHLRKQTRFKIVYIQAMLMLQFLIGLCSLATILLALFTPFYLRESVAQTILVIIINICLFTTANVQTSYLMQFALSSILENRQRNLLSTMRKFLATLWIFGSSGIIITLLGNLLSSDSIGRAVFGRMVFGVWTVFGAVAVIAVAAKFGYDIMQTLNESIALNAIPDLIEARSRLRMVIMRIIGIMVMFGSMCIINAILPVVLAQAYPIAGLFICLDGLIRTWGEFRPDLLREDQNSVSMATSLGASNRSESSI